MCCITSDIHVFQVFYTHFSKICLKELKLPRLHYYKVILNIKFQIKGRVDFHRLNCFFVPPSVYFLFYFEG